TATCTSADDAAGSNETIFYSTCNPSPCTGGAAAGVLDLGGGGGPVRLFGSSTYDHILYWRDKTSDSGTPSTSEIKVVGGSTTTLNGHIYAFSSDADVSGGSAATAAVLNVSILANTLKFTGNSNLVLNWNPVTAPKITRVALVE